MYVPPICYVNIAPIYDNKAHVPDEQPSIGECQRIAQYLHGVVSLQAVWHKSSRTNSKHVKGAWYYKTMLVCILSRLSCIEGMHFRRKKNYRKIFWGWEPEGHYRYSMMIRWEQSLYSNSPLLVLLWTSLMPFWPSTDDYKIQEIIYLDVQDALRFTKMNSLIFFCVLHVLYSQHCMRTSWKVKDWEIIEFTKSAVILKAVELLV